MRKYKVLSKVKKQHHEKRREAKNHENKVEEDPRIPNDWSFKVQEFKALHELELKKEV